jgi:hypothetical protein
VQMKILCKNIYVSAQRELKKYNGVFPQNVLNYMVGLCNDGKKESVKHIFLSLIFYALGPVSPVCLSTPIFIRVLPSASIKIRRCNSNRVLNPFIACHCHCQSHEVTLHWYGGHPWAGSTSE